MLFPFKTIPFFDFAEQILPCVFFLLETVFQQFSLPNIELDIGGNNNSFSFATRLPKQKIHKHVMIVIHGCWNAPMLPFHVFQLRRQRLRRHGHLKPPDMFGHLQDSTLQFEFQYISG